MEENLINQISKKLKDDTVLTSFLEFCDMLRIPKVHSQNQVRKYNNQTINGYDLVNWAISQWSSEKEAVDPDKSIEHLQNILRDMKLNKSADKLNSLRNNASDNALSGNINSTTNTNVVDLGIASRPETFLEMVASKNETSNKLKSYRHSYVGPRKLISENNHQGMKNITSNELNICSKVPNTCRTESTESATESQNFKDAVELTEFPDAAESEPLEESGAPIKRSKTLNPKKLVYGTIIFFIIVTPPACILITLFIINNASNMDSEKHSIRSMTNTNAECLEIKFDDEFMDSLQRNAFFYNSSLLGICKETAVNLLIDLKEILNLDEPISKEIKCPKSVTMVELYITSIPFRTDLNFQNLLDGFQNLKILRFVSGVNSTICNNYFRNDMQKTFNIVKLMSINTIVIKDVHYCSGFLKQIKDIFEFPDLIEIRLKNVSLSSSDLSYIQQINKSSKCFTT